MLYRVLGYNIHKGYCKYMIWQKEEVEWLQANQELDLSAKASYLKRSYDSVRKKVKSLENEGKVTNLKDFASVEGHIRVNEAGTILEGVLERRHITVDYIHEAYNIDPEEYKIVKIIFGNHEGLTKDNDGDAHIHQMVNFKVIIEPNKDSKFYKAVLDQIISRVPKAAPRVIKPTFTGENVLEIAIVDHHLGKKIAKGNTGYHDYDMEEALSQHMIALRTLVGKAQVHDVGKAIYVLGNDLLHIDTPARTTTRGTQQHTTGNLQEIFMSAAELTIQSVDFLRNNFKEVLIVCTPGNHDTISTWMLSKLIEAHYKDNEEVKHLNKPLPRQYVTIGNTIIMFTHGHQMKAKKLAAKMPGEIEWIEGKFPFKEIHVGHFHHEKVEDIDGKMYRILPSLTPVDEWHNDNGWIGANMRSKAFVWNPLTGCEAEIYFTPFYEAPEIPHFSLSRL